MTDCKKYNDLISRRIDGVSSGADSDMLDRHLAQCASCRRILAACEEISAVLKNAEAGPPAGFADGVMDKIRSLPQEARAAPPPRRAKSPVIRFAALAAVAACLVLAFVAAPRLGLNRSKSESAPEAPQGSLMSAGAGGAMAPESTEDNGSDNAVYRTQCDAADEAPPPPMAEMGMTSAPDAPGSDNTFTLKGDGKPDAGDYYALIEIDGQLPEALEGELLTESEDGVYTIEISAETADGLMADGYAGHLGNENADTALVLYRPD